MGPDCQTNGRPPVANGRPSPAQLRIAVSIQSTTVDRHGDPPIRPDEDQARPSRQTVDRSEPRSLIK
ncbi:unnamed protein product [Cuscuta campestris]|uniref:Uncharacterized protein n=1 Tax=Cuscuta campestris TaxID=132261 RepID=A0A484NB12_9ASTE|nr:unnamed protein product [Cuscuta campestris]